MSIEMQKYVTADRKYWRRAPHCGEKGHYNYSSVVVYALALTSSANVINVSSSVPNR